jgi:hypothetical protein
MLPQVALASSVPARPRRRSAVTSTQAMEANHRRSWLARMLAALVRPHPTQQAAWGPRCRRRGRAGIP